jgi:long-chain acyl-CoA synthetase
MNETAYAVTGNPGVQTLADTKQFIADADLPLQRIYKSEQERGASRLFTQPWQGQEQHWTWAEAMQEVRRMAAYLEAQHFPAGSRIAIMAKNSAWWIMADFAIWMAGHTSVPIFPTVQDASLLAIFNQSKPVAGFLGAVEHLPALDDPCLRDMQWIAFPHSEREGMLAWSNIVDEYAPVAGNRVRPADDIATIIYTSGTTGQPKGVLHSFRAVGLMGTAVGLTLGPSDERQGKEDRMLSYLPLAHIAERAIVETSTYRRALHVYFTEGQSSFVADLQRARATVFFTIPRLLIRFQQGVLGKVPQKKLDLYLRIPILKSIVRKKILRELGLANVRIAASGAAPLPPSVIEWYHKLGLNLVEGYGMTETGITHVPLPGTDRVGYVGQACPFAVTRISDLGEIQIKGPMNFAGYYLNPEATRNCFTEDGYFRTGDRGEIDEAGRLRIVGRLKEEFKTSKGKYVVPVQIEKALSLCQQFESVCVLGSGMTSPFALVVLTPEARQAAATAEGRVAMEAMLEEAMVSVNALHEHHEHLCFIAVDPRPWTTDNGLLTPTLKVRRSLIESRYESRFEGWEAQKRKIVWLESA